MVAPMNPPTPAARLSFLALPPELRLKIYQELLTTAEPQTLYHNWSLDCPRNIHPVILRVNRQIYAESAWILYEHNVFQIDLSTPSVIMRRVVDWYDNALRLTTPLFRVVDPSGEPLGYEGRIYPHCLRRLHHIELFVTGTSAEGGCMEGYLTPYFYLMVEILRRIVAEDEEDDDSCATSLANDMEMRGTKREKSLAISLVRNSEDIFTVCEYWKKDRMTDHGHDYDELINLLEKRRRVIWLIDGEVKTVSATKNPDGLFWID